MKYLPNIQKSPYGIYYLRIQRKGKDRKISLRTKDRKEAEISATYLRATILRMTVDESKIKNWTLKTDGDSIEITTEDNDADRLSAKDALVAFVAAKNGTLKDGLQAKMDAEQPTTTLMTAAIAEYAVHLGNGDSTVKTQQMAMSTLLCLSNLLKAGFDMSQLNDDIVEDQWLPHRLKTVGKTTARRDLTFIRTFSTWAADRKRKYCPSPIKYTFTAKGENWAYFTKQDLELIFDGLHKKSENAWQLWIPLIALYTGARVSEIASMRPSYIIEKSSVTAMRLAGTKTEASDRTIPIHDDLIEMGFLEYVERKLKTNRTQLFDVRSHNQNGSGATVSKWFTAYKKSIGLTDSLKVFHSFRPTIVDHLKQHEVEFEARCQYVGHDAGGGVHNKVYGRNELSLSVIKKEVVDKINWKLYCGFDLDKKSIKKKAAAFNK